MAIKKYIATKDTTITNAFDPNLRTRATGANMGASDVMEVFSIYGQMISSGSTIGFSKTQELSRILVQFDSTQMRTDRTTVLPESGSVKFYLRLFNAKHGQTTPEDPKYVVTPLSRTWEEGYGMDIDDYTDLTKDGVGANWIKSAGTTSWTNIGGDYLNAYEKTQTLTKANQDIELDITDIVEKWITGSSGGGFSNYGLGIHLTASQEAYFSSSLGVDLSSSIQNPDGAKRSYYTKKFFARKTQFFFKRPVIEARWDSSLKDDRAKTFYSSSLLPATDNLNKFFVYNYVNGQLKTFGDPWGYKQGALVPPVFVQLFSGSTDNTKPSGSALNVVTSVSNVSEDTPTVISGGFVLANEQSLPDTMGIYSASFAITASSPALTRIFDVWYLNESGVPGTVIYTGSFAPSTYGLSSVSTQPEYVFNITNLKDSYLNNEKARFELFARRKDWNPSIYTVANADPQNFILEDIYYRVTRIIDGTLAISFGTGSSTPQSNGSAGSYTRLSYDASGSYFDLDMSLLEPGYGYKLEFVYFNNNNYANVRDEFKFRVEEDLDG